MNDEAKTPTPPLQANLEKLVAARTAALVQANAQLQEEIAQREQASRRRGSSASWPTPCGRPPPR